MLPRQRGTLSLFRAELGYGVCYTQGARRLKQCIHTGE